VLLAIRFDVSIVGFIIGLMIAYPIIIIDFILFNRKSKRGETMDNKAPIVYELFGISWLSVNLANVLMIFITCVIVFVLSVLGARRLQMKPTGAQNVMEWVLDFVKGIVSDTMDWKTGRQFLPLAITLFSFILIGNILGVITTIKFDGVTWWTSPTADPGVTLTLSAMV